MHGTLFVDVQMSHQRKYRCSADTFVPVLLILVYASSDKIPPKQVEKWSQQGSYCSLISSDVGCCFFKTTVREWNILRDQARHTWVFWKDWIRYHISVSCFSNKQLRYNCFYHPFIHPSIHYLYIFSFWVQDQVHSEQVASLSQG